MNVAIFFRELLFSHLTPLIKLGRVRVIGENDFPPLAAHLSARTLASSRWNPNTRSPWRLILSATHSLGWRFWILYPIILWLVLLETSSPLIIRHLLTMISEGAAAMPLGEALATAIALCLVELVTALSRQHYIRLALESQLLTLNRLTTLIFDHSLRLTLTARGRLPTGDIVNHMAADADAISEVPGITGDFAYSVLIATSALIMMFAILGQAAWVVVVVLALLLPPTRLLARRFTRIDDILMRENDARVSLMTQILTGIRVIKYFAWEQLFSRRVASIRARELSARRKYVTSEIASVLVYLGTNSLVALAAFAAYWSLGGKLDAPTVFTCLALFNLLEHPFGAMAWHVSGMMAARVGARRVISFLAQPTLSPPAKPRVPSLSAIRLDNLSLAYPGQETILSDIHLEIRAGEAVAIVGPVGCGKSALIHAILGEMCPAAGRVSFDAPLSPPAIAFVPQSPWILNATLRENVLLGSTDDSSLRQILEMVGLGPDIALMPSGLLTEIGEHGINLSGGQKQRVNLARAVMTRSKIFLMDDPFSAVDHATEDHIARELIFGHLRGTTRVVTTHRLHHLGDFDRVVFLANGRMEGAAPLERLLSECPAFAAFYRDHISRLDAHSSRSQHLAMPGAEVREALSSADSSTTESRITEEEDREFGAVKGHLYVDYLLRLGGRSRLQRVATLTALFFGVALAAAGPVLHTAFLSAWMDVASQRLPTGMGQLFTRWVGSTPRNLILYGILGLLVMILTYVVRLAWGTSALRAARDLHNDALTSVLASPVRFFDKTPIGRVLNRFSRDLGLVEQGLAWSFEQAVHTLFQLAASVIALLVVVPQAAFMTLPVVYLFLRVQSDYRKSGRESKRLSSITRSPRYAHFKETLGGLPLVRAHEREGIFRERFFDLLDRNLRSTWTMYLLNRWFSTRVPLLSSLLSLTASLTVVFAAKSGHMASGTAGFALVYATQFWNSLNWATRAFSEAESRMTSFERLSHYGALPAEPSTTRTPALDDSTLWPTRGEIRCEHVAARYDTHLPYVLHDIHLHIPARARVGIAGRTGSGKTTLFQALFRIIPLAQGRILIDGVDITSIPLPRLRRALALIPQDPVFFDGTLRNNLDEENRYSDDQLWLVLDRVALGDFVRALPEGLSSKVLEGGNNFSHGQRQLLCAARALLTDAKIILLDEATASVDVATDALVQRTIREAAQDATLVIIAHRLESIADCDLVIELSEGRVTAIHQR